MIIRPLIRRVPRKRLGDPRWCSNIWPTWCRTWPKSRTNWGPFWKSVRHHKMSSSLGHLMGRPIGRADMEIYYSSNSEETRSSHVKKSFFLCTKNKIHPAYLKSLHISGFFIFHMQLWLNSKRSFQRSHHLIKSSRESSVASHHLV